MLRVSTTPDPIATAASIVMRRCDEFALCSEEPGKIVRPFLSRAMREAHGCLSDWMCEAGQQVRVDAAGNMIGRKPAAVETRRVLLIGSHIDSVPNAGKYDGVVGVLIALAAVELLADARLPFHVDVIAFSEEEGVRFAMPYLGSHAIVGRFKPEWLQRTDDEGCSMESAIREFGLNPSDFPAAAYREEDVLGYVEPHIEQGPLLEQLRHPVGIVSGFAGQSRLRVEFRGQAAHAGTTPMDSRHDALVGASRWISAVSDFANKVDNLRATVGCIRTEPNAPNVVPAVVELSLDVRHVNDLEREAAVSHLLDKGEQVARDSHLRFAVLDQMSSPAARVDEPFSQKLVNAVVECGHAPTRLVSGAGHDAVPLSQSFPTAMLFIRHPGGVSHHPDETVDEADVAVAIDVVYRFLSRLAEST